MADVTYFKMEIEGVTRQRAEAVGMNYEAILRGCGLTSTVWDTGTRITASVRVMTLVLTSVL